MLVIETKTAPPADVLLYKRIRVYRYIVGQIFFFLSYSEIKKKEKRLHVLWLSMLFYEALCNCLLFCSATHVKNKKEMKQVYLQLHISQTGALQTSIPILKPAFNNGCFNSNHYIKWYFIISVLYDEIPNYLTVSNYLVDSKKKNRREYLW